MFERVRDIEMRLFEEVGTQLKGLTDAMRDFTLEMREVRERLVRIDAQDQPGKISTLQEDVRAAVSEIAKAQFEIKRVEQEATSNIAAAVATVTAHASTEKLAMEGRLIRMETIIAPLTVGGSAFLAAILSALVAFALQHFH